MFRGRKLINNFIFSNNHLTDFLKSNLTKFAVISVKKHQKARFLSPTSPKIIATKEKKRRKRKSEGKEEKKKSNGCTLSFCNSYFGEFLAEKNCWTQKGLLGDNVIKNPARYIYFMPEIIFVSD